MATGASASKYWGSVKWLGGSAVVAVLVGLVFGPISRALFSEELRSEVIIQAIPFVAYFAAIILLFILAIALVSSWLHLSIPFRTHRAVEFTAIAGIFIGIVGLFQPWHQAPYRYAFNVLLFATLGFILWSHVVPRGARDDAALPGFSRRGRWAGLVAAVVVAGLIFANLAVSSRPQEPYGLRQRRWDAMREEQRQEVILTAGRDYRFVNLPTLLVYSLLPGLATYFLVREFATPKPGGTPEGSGDA